MKKEVTVKVGGRKAIPPHTKKKAIIYCDVCTEKIETARRYVCCLCGRDMHGYNWANSNQCMKVDDWDYGDYPDKYCIFCWELKFAGKYELEYEAESERHEKAKKSIDRKIKKESLAK